MIMTTRIVDSMLSRYAKNRVRNHALGVASQCDAAAVATIISYEPRLDQNSCPCSYLHALP